MALCCPYFPGSFWKYLAQTSGSFNIHIFVLAVRCKNLLAFIFLLFLHFQDPTAEDTMVVQLILASRMGTRELESNEEDENAFEIPCEHL